MYVTYTAALSKVFQLERFLSFGVTVRFPLDTTVQSFGLRRL